MRVRELYMPDPVTVEPGAGLRHAATRMREQGVGSLLIMRGERLSGILTEHDIVAAVAEGLDLTTTPVGSYMTDDPVSVHPDRDSSDVAMEMMERGVRHLPVVEDDRLLGMISARDLLTAEAWPRMGGGER